MPNYEKPLRIIKVELTTDSLKTSRELAGDYGKVYPVIAWFSRIADRFERKALEEELAIKFDNNDPMRAIFPRTALEVFENEIDQINSSIDNAVANARHDREAAEREDTRLKELADTVSTKLRADYGELAKAQSTGE